MGTARALNQNSLRVSRIDASPAPHSRDEVDEEPNTRWNRLAWQERGEKLDAVTPKIRQAFDKHPRCKAEPCPYRKLNPVGY